MFRKREAKLLLELGAEDVYEEKDSAVGRFGDYWFKVTWAKAFPGSSRSWITFIDEIGLIVSHLDSDHYVSGSWIFRHALRRDFRRRGHSGPPLEGQW